MRGAELTCQLRNTRETLPAARSMSGLDKAAAGRAPAQLLHAVSSDEHCSDADEYENEPRSTEATAPPEPKPAPATPEYNDEYAYYSD